jgi:hypothetical protein
MLALIPTLFLVSCASFSMQDMGDLLSGQAPLTQETVADGLREALQVGTERAASRLSVTDAFAGVAARRIGIPEELDTIASRLRSLGLGPQIDDFELRMNRAAEQAAAQAVPVFAQAVREMTIADAFAILDGPDSAATLYFQDRTTGALTQAFTPVVRGVMEETGVFRVYEDLVDRYTALPFTRAPSVDLVEHIVGRTTGVLFNELAVEERRIREDPVARTTDLLKRVFQEGARRLPSSRAQTVNPSIGTGP